MSRRNKHRTHTPNNINNISPRADYDAVTTGTKRRAVRTAVKSEDAMLTQAKRRKLTATSQDILRNFELVGWALRLHLDYVSQFNIQFTTPDEIGRAHV